MVRSTMAILAPGPVGTDRSRKMMQIAPTDAPKSCFWSQNRLRNISGHLGGNLAPEVQTFFFRDHVAAWTGGTQVIRLGSAFLAGAFDFWEKHEPWLLLPCYSMTMEIAKLLRAPRHAPTQIAKA